MKPKHFKEKKECMNKIEKVNNFPCLICGNNIFDHNTEYAYGGVICLLQLHDILKGHAKFNNIMKKLEMKKI